MKIRPYRIIALMILIIGCVLSFASFLEMKRQDDTLLRQNLSENVDNFLAILKYRYLANEEVLKGARGLVEASKYVSEDEWEKYIVSLDLQRGFPAIVWTALVKYVPAKEKDAFLKSYEEKEGKPIKIWPESSKEALYPILFIEPKGYSSLKGYTLSDQNDLKQDLDSLLTERGVAAGPPININPITVKNSSFLFLLPIYQENQLFGCVAATVDLGLILERIISETTLALSNLTVYEGDVEDPEKAIFQKTKILHLTDSLITIKKHVEFGQTKWTFVFSMQNNYVEELTRPHPTYVLLSLLGLTLALFFLFFYLPSFSSAISLENISCSPFMTHLLDHLKQPLILISPKGELTFWNRAAAHLLGYESNDITAKKELISLLEPEDLKQKISLDPSSPNTPLTSEKCVEALKADEYGSLWTLLKKDNTQIKHKLHIDELSNDKGEVIGFILSISTDTQLNGSTNHSLGPIKEALTTMKGAIEGFMSHGSLNDEEKGRIKGAVDKINSLIGYVENGK